MATSFIVDQFQFAEMNIRHTGSMEKTMTMIRRAIRMGYDSIVVNIEVENLTSDPQVSECTSDTPPKKKRKGNSQKLNVIPAPVEIDVSKLDTSSLVTKGKHLRIFSRLTVTISESLQMHWLMHDSRLKKYDVIAVRPTDEQILQTLSRKGDFADLICLPRDSNALHWLSKSKLIQQCVSEGLTFEITYADALSDSNSRRDMLSNARRLMQSTRGGRGVVLASGATEMIDIRAPYDVCNLAVLFGISAEHSRQFISGNARKALLRAETRTTIKGGMVVVPVNNIPAGLKRRLNQIKRLVRIPELRAKVETLSEGDHSSVDHDSVVLTQ